MIAFLFSINLRKEVADGLRIYFDFILKDYLLYKQEIQQASLLLSPENLKSLTYVGSEKEKEYAMFIYYLLIILMFINNNDIV